MLDRYLAKLILLPMMGTLALTATLLMLEKGLRLLQLVVDYGGGLGSLWEMLGFLAPEFFSMGIPFSLLVGVLAAFRRLALNLEIDTLQAAGVSPFRMLRVPLLYALVLAAGNVAVLGYVQPIGRYAYEQLRYDLVTGRRGALFNARQFSSLGSSWTLYFHASERGGMRMTGLFLRSHERGPGLVSLTARSGTVRVSRNLSTIVLRLEDGVLVRHLPNRPRPELLSFRQYDIPIEVPRSVGFRARGDGTAEMTLSELLHDRENLTLPRPRRIAIEANIYYRGAQLAVLLLLPLLAVGLAKPRRGSTSSVGLFIGVVLLVTYFKAIQYAERMAVQERILPHVALAIPFLVFAALAVFLHRRAAFKAGSEPLGRLERGIDKLGEIFLIALGVRRSGH